VVYTDFFDNTQQRPIASIQDYTAISDNISLGATTAYINKDASITNCNGSPRLPRVWQIIPTTNGAANVRLYFTQTELNALAPFTFAGQYGTLQVTDLELWKFNDGQMCAAIPTVVPFTVLNWSGLTAGYPNNKAFTSTSGVIGIEFAVSSFSHFVLVPKATALLANKLTQFDAQKQIDNSVNIFWKTDTEEELNFFEVEKSINGIDFETLQQVAAFGDANAHFYTQNDKNPNLPQSYYRLKMYKKDASFIYSAIKMVNFEQNQQLVSVYPNPNNGKLLNVQLNQFYENLQISISDVTGRKIWIGQYNQVGNLLTINPNLSAGVYALQLQSDNYQQTIKIVVR
jgi:Secretion system C-terminal sorting domain